MATSLINGLGGTAGFGENALPRADDTPSLEIDLTSIVAGGIDLFGETYTSLFINYNGSVTFGDPLEAFSPTSITAATTIPIVAPFWGDVDTRAGTVTATPGGTSTGSNLVWYDLDTVNDVFTVTWDDVAYYNEHSDKLNAFQLRIIPVGANGDFDIQFRYETINWTTGDASGGSGGLGGDVAVAGYSAGDGVNFFQLPQSGNQSGMLGLPNASNVASPGLFVFSVRSGIPVVAQFSISAASADKAEGNGGSTAFTFTVTLAGDASTARSVTYAVAGSGANPAGAADFTGGVLPAGTISFAAGETSKTLTVNVQGDTVAEADETFIVSLSAPTGGATLGTNTATGTIRNDDSAAGGTQVSIAAASADRAEGNVGPTPFTFTLTRTGDSSGTHTVNWAVTGSGAAPTNGTDFVGGVLPSGSVTFAPGETSKTLTVNIQGDLVVEADETFTVTISAPAQSSGNQTTSNTGTIPSTGQTLGISLTAHDASSSTSEAVSGFVSRSGGSGTGQYNIAFVIDRSGSTADTFVGKQAIGDLNGDGTANTILDAEIAGFEALLASINGLGLGSANIAVISFESGATTHLTTTVAADANKNGTLDVVETLRSLKATGSTNYEAGLQQAETFFAGTPAGNDVVFFLSDGFPDSQAAFTDEVSRLLAAKTDIRAFGVGSGASPTALDLVDDGLANNTATIVLDPSQLTSGLLGGGVKLAEIARVELLVNGVVVQTIQPNQLVQTPLGLQYTGTLTGLSVSSAEQITARVVATDAATTTVSTTQTLEVAGVAIGTSTATGIVRNDDGITEICIETASSTLKEGHVGPTPFTFTVTREGDLSGTHSVKWSVSSIGGAPANAVDFVGGVLPSGTVTFAPGESAKTITVNVQGDTGLELDETFLVSLSSPATVGGGGSGNQTTSNSGTIVSTGQTLGISLTAPDASSSTSEAVSGLVSRSGGSGTGQYNIAFVVDRSGSTGSTFSGAKTVADLNGDGTANTVLDAEIAGFEAVLASINGLGLGSATIAVISFESGAATNLVTTAGADANKNGVLDVVEALRGLKTGGSTNYEAGLQQAEAFYKGAPSGQNVLFFLSDGQPDSTTAYADEVSRLLAAKVGIQAFGVGSGAQAGPLDLVDDGVANNTATIVLDPSQLTSGLLGGGVKLAEIARVELLVNGVVVQTIQPNQLVQTPLGLQYTGTMTGLSVSSAEQITARVIATDPAATTIATTQTLEVLSGSTVQLCDDPTAIGTIINDDTEICVETANSTLKEGHVGPTPFTFTVTREGDLSGTHSVKWSVSSIGGAPANAVDFVGGVLPSGTVTFAPGESAKTITVNVQGDTGVELDETFLVSLSSPATVGGGGSGNQTTSNSGTIVSTGQTLGISLTAPDASSSTSEAVSGLVSRSGGSGTGQYNIAFVVDRSGSTGSTFSGAKTVADLNGDGTANTVLDAEIAGFEAVLASINSLGLGSATIAVISFESGAATNLVTTAGADANKNGVLDVVEALRGLKTGGSTNYEAGLQQAEAFYKGAPSGQNVLFFLSDGQPDSTTAYADEVSRLLAAKVGIQAFGVGSGAQAGPLDLVDDGVANNTATIVLDPSQLTSGLLGGGVKLAEIARVELLVNGVVVQTIQPNQLVQTPLGLQYTGTLTGLSVSASEQITARVIATDPAATTIATTQTLEVLSGSHVQLCDDPTAVGTIINDDTEICIETANSTLKEGHVGPTPFTFTVTREGDLSGTHSVKWSVSSTGGAPANAVDFVGGVLPSGTVTFAPGESAKTITVNVQGDTGMEADETFLVSLSSPATVGGGGSGNQTTSNSGTIVSTGQTLGISLTAPDASSSTSEAVSGLVSRSGGSGTGQYNIAFVVDRSGSTGSTFSGAKTVADLNGDGTANTVLDAEIAGFEAVLASINSLGLGSATIAVISFESGAATNLVTTAGADANKNGVLDVVEALRGLKTGGSTNYEAGLQQAEAFYKGAPSGQNVLFFLSDGQPDSTTAYADEVSRLLAAKVGIQAFGVGSGAQAGPLDLVDDGLANNTATIVLDPSQLTSGLLGGGVKLAEIARVELLVNGVVVQTIQPNQLVQTPLGLQYTGTLTGLSVSASEQITARVIATDAAATTIATTQTLEVLSGSGVVLCDDPTAIGTILNDDGTEICIHPANATLKEGHVGATPFTFTVEREGDLSGTHSVKWSVSSTGGAPANVVDFVGGVLPSGTVTFAPGESAKTITVNVQGDRGVEADETFLVSLSSPATVGGGSGNQTTSNSGTIVSTGQTLGISLTAPDASSSTSEAVSGLVSRSGGSGTGQYNIAFVVDRSGSTGSTFSGAKTVADLNGDGTANTVLDAEIAGFEAVLASINSLGLGSATIAVISFESGAATNLVTTAGADANKNGVLDVVEALRGLKTGGSTNYEAGLQQAEAFYKGAPSGQNVLFFLSDGQPDSTTAYADEVSRLLAAKVGIQAFGVGSGAQAGPLDLVDDGVANNTATIVLDPSQLTSGLLGGGVKLAEIARVELLVNGVVVQTIQPNQLVQTPLGLQYTGTLTGLSVSASEQITARVIATDPAATTVATTQTLEVLSGSTVQLCTDHPTAVGTILNDDAAILTAYDDAYIASKDTTLHMTASSGVLFNDIAVAPVTATLLTNPTRGTVVLSANGGFDYTPAQDRTGIDKFTYRTTGANGTDDAEAVIYITPVNVGASTTLALVALTAEQQIGATYTAFFGRGADAGGFQFWVGEFQRELPVQGPAPLFANIASSFGISNEAKALYPFLASPFTATDPQIASFVDSVYNNLFNRSSDAGGLGYWTGQIRQTLASGKFVGSVLVDIMSGAQDTVAGKDMTTLMGKVAVTIEYVQEQQRLGSIWTAPDDGAEARTLLQAVTADPLSVLVGVARAHDLVVADIA